MDYAFSTVWDAIVSVVGLALLAWFVWAGWGAYQAISERLKDTTMNPAAHTLAGVAPDEAGLPDFDALVETRMGRKRFNYIQQNARFVEEVDV